MKDDRLKLIDENEEPLTEKLLLGAFAAAKFSNELYDLLKEIQQKACVPESIKPKPDKNS